MKERLNNLRLDKNDFACLQMFVGPNAAALKVPAVVAKRKLGKRLFDRLIEGSVLTTTDHHAEQFVHVHNLVAQIIYVYRDTS